MPAGLKGREVDKSTLDVLIRNNGLLRQLCSHIPPDWPLLWISLAFTPGQQWESGWRAHARTHIHAHVCTHTPVNNAIPIQLSNWHNDTLNEYKPKQVNYFKDVCACVRVCVCCVTDTQPEINRSAHVFLHHADQADQIFKKDLTLRSCLVAASWAKGQDRWRAGSYQINCISISSLFSCAWIDCGKCQFKMSKWFFLCLFRKKHTKKSQTRFHLSVLTTLAYPLL